MKIDKEKCIGCGTCVGVCPVSAISFDEDGKAQINNEVCIQCGTCKSVCPVEVIED